MTMQGRLDARFSQATEPLSWPDVDDVLRNAELYWLTTTRGDGRPHVTPLVGLWVGDMFVFCTGPTEQKARNLEHRRDVVVTTGVNKWRAGLDVVVEGAAERVTYHDALTHLADAYREKYSGEWDFDVDADAFTHGDGARAYVFRVPAQKVIAFAKSPHGQTTFHFG
jgi:hypothetical protein